MIKKLQSAAIMAVMILMTGCGKDATDIPQPAADDWTPTVTRSTGGSGEGSTEAIFKNDVRISAVTSLDKLSEPAVFSDIFLSNGNWQEGGNHSWGDPTRALYLIAIYPTTYNGATSIPTIVSNGDTEALMVGYQHCNEKPASGISFAMKHLMGQLQVHIKIAGNTNTVPTDATITLYKCKSINYAATSTVTPYTKDDAGTDAGDAGTAISESFGLGTFTLATDESGNYVNTPQVIIPQTLTKDVECLSFKIGEAQYTFTPEKDIVMAAGKKTHLYLGVAYDEKCILIGDGVSVEDWGTDIGIGGGEADETTK